MRAFVSLVRVGIVAVAVAVLVMIWRFVVPGIPGLLSSDLGAGAFALELSLDVALALVPVGLVVLAVWPGLWRLCAMPIVWTVVATIILRPQVFERWL
jgi:hypothetical protein